jgi:hypothetical protein
VGHLFFRPPMADDLDFPSLKRFEKSRNLIQLEKLQVHQKIAATPDDSFQARFQARKCRRASSDWPFPGPRR